MKANVARLLHRSVRYYDVGQGRPVVLLHAFPLSAEQWLPQLHRVPRGWRLVAPDLRGFGIAGDDSSGPEGLAIDDYADDVLALMAHLDIPRGVIAGLSMGGYVAFAIWRKAAARVSGLVLSNTRASADSAEARAGRDRMIDLVRREGPSAVASEMIPRLLGATTRLEQPDLEEAIRVLIEANSADAIATGLRALRDRPDSTPLLSSISCPTVVIGSDEDVIVPVAEAEALHRAIAGSSLLILPQAGHLSSIESERWGTGLFSTDFD